MNRELKIDLNDSSIVGVSSPDPLRFAFSRKTGAHAGGMTMPIAPDEQQSIIENALSQSVESHSGRCLYIHIPFCRVRCTYCNFFQHASKESLIEKYMAALMQEFQWKSELKWVQSAPFRAVYVGGGTPTDLSAKQLKQLGQAIRRYFWLTPDCEITLEGRVNRFTEDKFEHALDGGFNRFSFGVQSFDTKVRRSAKRLDDREVVFERLRSYISYNQAPIVVDLLYGLPYQTLEVWQNDLESYLEVGADGVDLYQLIEMQGLPMERMVEQGRLPHPADTQTKATMFEMGVNFMAQHHQRRLSVNHWTSSNRERSLYNSLAKTCAEVLPLGAGAGGNFGGLQMMHHRDMHQYCDAIENKQFPAVMAFRSGANRNVDSVIKAAFDRGVLAKRDLNYAAKDDLFTQALPLFLAWQDNGLVTVEQEYISLTLAGAFWSVNLAQILIGVLS